MPYIPQLQFALQHLWEKNRWGLSSQLQYLSARKSAAEFDVFDLPQSLVVNEAVSFALTEHVTFKLSIQNMTDTRHIVAARPAGYRTFAPRMALLSINASL
jgi:outer membrane receptor for monomeric catechols